jgi:cytochrome P450
MNPHFHTRAVAQLTENLRTSIERELAQYWRPAARSGAACDIYPLVAGLTMSTALASMFGTRITRAQSEELRGAIAHALRRIILTVLGEALPDWLPLPQRRGDKAARASIARLIQALIDDRRRDASYGGDVAAMLIHASESADMSEQELHDQIFSLFFASYDTVSNALAWTLHLLASHPAQLARVRSEAEQPEAPRAPHELPQLPISERVFKEALRLYPSAALIPRFSLADDELGGYRIPAGSMLFVLVWGIQRNPRVWPQPELFDPDRFSPEAEAAQPRLAFLPFGAGQHLCLGKHLAVLEAQLILSAVARQFDLTPLPERPPRPRIAMNMAAEDGVWLRLRERSS